MLPVLTAVTDARWESELVGALERTDHGVRVVRRCVDLADLLATAAAGTARAALLAADLRRLDRDALTRLALARVAVVGLVAPGDEDAERRLRQLGVLHVLPADAGPEQISATVLEAVQEGAPHPRGLPASFGDPRAALPDLPPDLRPDPPAFEPEIEPGEGRLVAVWGPTGAPGRSSVALGIAGELACLGVPTLLIDADTYGGVVAQLLGLLDESPGLAAACRSANNGQLDLPGLAALAREASPGLRVLTGIVRAERWPEVRPHAFDVVLSLARSLVPVTVVDCGFALEQDEELAYDTTAPRRNGATLAALAAADTVLAVGAADPVGLQRLVRGLSELRAAVPGVEPQVVVNRVRRSAVGGDPAVEIPAALERYAGIAAPWLVPDDPSAYDAALRSGRTLAESAPDSKARAVLAALAAALAGRTPPQRRRGRLLGLRR